LYNKQFLIFIAVDTQAYADTAGHVKNADDCMSRAGEITQPTECQCCVGSIQGMKQTQVQMSKDSRHAPGMKKNAVKFIGRRQYQLQILARCVRLSPAGTAA
jgi:hypothetical protein